MSHKVRTIPLCQLRPGKANIRKTDRLAGIAAMAENIRQNDLLENLVVQLARKGNGHDPLYEVVAGGRRYAALKLLAKRRKITTDYPVRCLLLSEDASAVEVSLAENLMRMPLHPADQFEAFAALGKEGLSVDELAARFGVTPAFVQQRLKLACLSPKLIAEYRSGAITLEQLTAFTLSDSHAAQEEVWFERAYAEMPAHLIRRLLTTAQVPGDDPRTRFIGAQAYTAAGGTITRDLFDAEDDGYFSDSQLLDRLVHEKLALEAKEVLQEGWQWVEIHPDADLALLARFGRAESIEVELSEAEQAQLSKLGDRYDELVAALEEGDETDAAEIDRLQAEIAKLEAKTVSWALEAKAQAGVIVSLGQSGRAEIHRGLLKTGHPGAETAQKDGGRDSKKRVNGHGGYADSVLLDLSAHRTAALRELMAQRPEVAKTALLHALVNRLFYRGVQSCICIQATHTELDRASQSVRESKAAEAFAARHSAWQAKLPESAGLWDWLGGLNAQERDLLMAHCVALTIDALKGGGDPGQASTLAAALGLDMRDWWQPTQKNFLGRLTKNDILAAVAEGVSQQASWRLASLKKDRMAKEAEKLLADSAWLPLSLKSIPPTGATS